MEQLNYYGIIALSSFVLTLGLILLSLHFFPKWKLMDRPKKYGLKRSPIPYYGGLLIFVTFLVLVFAFEKISVEILGLLIASSLITVTGFLDDYFSLPPFVRLIVQVICGIILVYFGVYILSVTNPLGGSISLDKIWIFGVPLFGALFTILWVVLITNTVNFLDGVGGLSSGVSFIAFLTLFFLSIRPDIHANLASQETVAVISLILAFSCLAFAIFDFPPPRILMGDTGSTFLGFMLAALSIFSGGKIATAFLVLGLPILDALFVIFRRIFEGKKPWQGDLKHLHHRLLKIGLKDYVVLIIIYSISFVFGALAIFTTNARQKFFVLISLLIFMVLFVLGIIMQSRKRAKINHK